MPIFSCSMAAFVFAMNARAFAPYRLVIYLFLEPVTTSALSFFPSRQKPPTAQEANAFHPNEQTYWSEKYSNKKIHIFMLDLKS